MCLLDQTLLPLEVREIECRDVETVFEAIRSLRVRGAPAIGIAAAYGLVLGASSAAASARGILCTAYGRCPATWPPAGPRPSTFSGRSTHAAGR